MAETTEESLAAVAAKPSPYGLRLRPERSGGHLGSIEIGLSWWAAL
jgi:hypothetical protein